MITPDWWIIPYNIVNGLTMMPMQPSTDEDLDKLPHVILPNRKCTKTLSKGSLLGCFEYVPYTTLTIVLIIKTINVRLD